MATPSTRYLDLRDMRSLVEAVGLRPFLREVLEALRADYSRWESFEKMPRTANHHPLGVLELMPVSDGERFSFKYVNGHPTNPAQQLSTVMAFGALAEMNTGWPVMLSEMTILTAIRTAATSVLAASLMARPDCKTMAMIGNGAQSEFQLIAFHEFLGIDTFRVYDIDPAATDKLMRNLQGEPGITCVPCKCTAEAVEGADIITTCTADKAFATIVTDAMVKPGMHLNGIGGDCPGKTELEAAILNRSSVVVEFEPQSRIEGELQQMPADFQVTELWEVVTGKSPGRVSAEEITVFDSVGFALEDFAVLRVAHRLAEQHNIGSHLNLMPVMADVKDLYGLISPAGVRV